MNEASKYPCGNSGCTRRAAVVYQPQSHPFPINGACLRHLNWTSDPSRSVLEGAKIIHVDWRLSIT